MNNFSTLQPIVRRSKKRLGRGHGSGKVKTSGRGTKGQKARDSIRPGFEGGQLALIHRLPLLRGKGRNKALVAKAFPVSVEKLEQIPEGTTVTLSTLEKYHIIEEGTSRVKILGGKGLTHKLTVKVNCSASARKLIEKAGGAVEA
jgi:large subunit ribosomal protein L15